MARVGFNPNIGTIKTDADTTIDRAFLAHYHVPAAQAVAASTTGIMAFKNLGAAVQAITAGLTNPVVPRNVQIDGNASGITGNVKITGTNFKGDAIDETIALNGTTAVVGAKAFKSITKVDLPVQVHTPVLQVETATAAGTVTTAGNASVTITTALLEEDEVVAVPVVLDDDAAAIALAIRTALAANANIAAHFDVSGEAAEVILTAKLPAANDATLNIAIADGTGEGASVGVTTAATSANTTAGVATDQVSVGWGDIFGLPYKLYADELVILKLFNKAADAATVVANATALESNTFDLNGTPDGEKDIDLYIVV